MLFHLFFCHFIYRTFVCSIVLSVILSNCLFVMSALLPEGSPLFLQFHLKENGSINVVF